MSSKEITREAFLLFAQKGYLGTSLSDIADRVGIKKPSIYAHFSSKEELFFTVLDNEIKRVNKYLDMELNQEKDCSTEEQILKFSNLIINQIFNEVDVRNFWYNTFFCPTFLFKDAIDMRLAETRNKIYNIQKEIFIGAINKKEIKEIDIDKIIYSFNVTIMGNLAMMNTGYYSKERMMTSLKIFWAGIKNDIVYFQHSE